MLFPHESLLTIRSCPAAHRGILRRSAKKFAAGNPVPSDWTEIFSTFLQELPPAQAMAKIVRRLENMAKAHGAELSHFLWWDIVSKQRSLLATLRYKRDRVSVAFYWKRTAKSKKVLIPFGHCSFVPDGEAFHGQRLEIEGGTYQEMKASFEGWLSQYC